MTRPINGFGISSLYNCVSFLKGTSDMHFTSWGEPYSIFQSLQVVLSHQSPYKRKEIKYKNASFGMHV